MFLSDLPKDILRLILPLINDTKGYHSLICSSKLLHQLGKGIIRQKKVQFRRTFSVTNIINSKRCIETKQVLPNGTLDGIAEKIIYTPPDIIRKREEYSDGLMTSQRKIWINSLLVIQESYLNGKRDGFTYRWYYPSLGNTVLYMKALYDQDTLLLQEEFLPNGNRSSKSTCKFGLMQMTTDYDSHGRMINRRYGLVSL